MEQKGVYTLKIGRAALAAKLARKDAGITQLEMTFNGYYGTRESVSRQENGNYKVQPQLSNYYAEHHNDPFVALEAAAEYLVWGPQKLDGEATDLHRTNVLLKTAEELEEALEAINMTKKKITSNPECLTDAEKEVIEKSILETIDVITAATHYVAVFCKTYGISWVKMWTQHRMKLIQRKFLRK